MSDRLLLLKVNDAAAAIAVSRRTFYALIQTNADIRAAVVEIPGVRGKFIRSDLLRRAIERMSPQGGNES